MSSVAGILTAIGTLLTALGVAATAFAVLIPILRRTKELNVKANVLSDKTDAVHKIVNQQRTDAMNYQGALIAALRKAGVDIPDDQSRPVPDPE